MLLSPPYAPAAASSCTVHTGPDYSVNLCINSPANGATVSGDVSVTASVAITGNNPGVAKVLFYLDGEYLLTDYETPYEFDLPTDTMVDGLTTLAFEAVLRDDAITAQASVGLTFSNGNATVPPPPTDFTVRTGTTPAPGQPFRLFATGDGASGQTTSDQVVDLMVAENPNMFLYLGDVYDLGTYTEFKNWYGEADSWGQLAPITNPVLGNHEREGSEWPGYDRYWGTPDPFYAYDANGWRFLALNISSNAGVDAAQLTWLADELATNTAACTVAFFHYPVESVGPIGSTPALFDLWSQMVDAGVDLVLTGHEHNYQRWLPMDRDRVTDPNGVTQFVLGGGGHGIRPFGGAGDPRMAVGLDSVGTAYGALDLHLNSDGAFFQYLAIDGQIRDSGTFQCSGTPTDVTAPSVPQNVAAQADDHTEVNITWDASVDNVGVDGYEVRRDGQTIGQVAGSVLSFVDDTVSPSTSYSYTATAVDAAGNSSTSAPVVFTVPAPSSQLTIDVEADAWVDSTTPTVNLGTGVDMRVDNSPDRRAYVRFDVGGVTGSVVSATLRVFTDSSHSAGFEARPVIQTWGETTITYNSAPAYGILAGSSGPTVAGTYVDVDVTGTVTGNGSVSYALTPINGTNLRLAARESGNGAQLVINQTVGTNQAPTAVGGSVTTNVDNPVDVTLTATDPEGACPISFTVLTNPVSGTVSPPSSLTCTGGSATATVTYTPDPGFTGDDQFQFTVTDSGGETSTPADVLVTVDPAAAEVSFTAIADSYIDGQFPTRNHGSSSQIRVDASPDRQGYFKFDVSGLAGTATGATVRLYALSNHSQGYDLAVVNDSSWTELGIDYNNAPPSGLVLGSSGSLSSGNYYDIDVSSVVGGEGTYSFAAIPRTSTNFRLAPRQNENPPVLVITQSTVANEPPTAGPVSVTTDEDQTAVWTPTVSDPDGNPLTCSIGTSPTVGSASVASDCTSGSYDPDPDQSGVDSFSYVVSDGIESATATVTVTVTPVADAPTADSRTVSGLQDTSTVVDLSGADVDGDCGLTLSVSAPTSGTLGPVTNQTCTNGDVAATVTYTPDPGFAGTDGFSYSITDSTGLTSNTATVDLIIDPTPTSVTFSVAEDTYADGKFSNTNRGTSNSMLVDGSPARIGYLKFNVGGAPGTTVLATLRVRCLSSSSSGFAVATVVDGGWAEASLTYANRPVPGPQVALSGPLTKNTWIDIPVAVLVAADGTVSLALEPLNNTSIRLASRESGQPAELVVDL